LSDPAITVSGVWKNFRLYHEKNQHLKAAVLRGRRARYEEFWALKGVDLEIPHGATFGLIGSNGSGKSTLLKCLARILYPNKGSVSVSGRLCALLELGSGFHPELSGRENVYLNGAILGMSKRDVEARFDEIVEFAGLEKFIDTPVKNYSNGMQLRLGFSIASHVDPEILLIDEVLAVGDQAFQRKCGEKIESFRTEGRTIVIVSHGLASILQLCDNAAWLEKGEIRRIGPSPDVVAEYTGDSLATSEREESEIGSRWGNGAATINEIRLINDSSVTTRSFTTGQTMRIEVDYTANRKLEETVFSLRFTSLHGTEVWAANSKRRREFIHHLKPSGTVVIEVPDLPLLEGSYDITAIITDATEKRVYDWWDRRIRFDVTSGSNFDEGLVTIKSNWNVEGARLG
jgi:ABC-type polysaccharide/polyol phosphate transport system ATPase subunit